jgi:hypothetical protein
MEEAMHISSVDTQPRAPLPFYRHLYFQVIVAIVAGMLVGHYYPEFGASLKPFGDAFIKLVKMIIAPVIFLTVATGIAGMNDLKKVGRVAGKAMIYFLTFSTLALAIGSSSPTPCSRVPACTSILPRSTPRRWRPTPSKAHESDHHRLPDEHHPDRPSSAPSRKRRHPAGAVLLGAVRHRARHGRRAGQAGHVDFMPALM